MFLWWTIAFLVLAAVCGILGFFVLQGTRKGFAKVMFWIALIGAFLFFLFGYVGPA